jgi:hypothetical protein
MTRIVTAPAIAGLLAFAQTATAQQRQVQPPPTVLTGQPSSGGVNPQQDRMKSCSGDASARALHGQAHRSFMSACLSGKNSPAPMMKVCNAQATQNKMTEDARSAYISGRLKTGS